MENDERNKYLEAQGIWDSLETVEPTWKTDEVSHKKTQYSSDLVTVEEFIHFLTNNQRVQSQNYEVFESQSNTLLQDRITHFFKCCLKRNEKLQSLELEQQKSLIFKVSRTQLLENEERMYYNVLLTLYKQLTGNRFDVPRYGCHWEDIGFQGNDPATDLRGVGLLGLVQPLYLVMNSDYKRMALDFFSNLNVRKDGLLNSLCNQKCDAWKAVNTFYVSIIYRIYHLWKSKGLTIRDSGYVLKEVEDYSRKYVTSTITDLENYTK
ncbi:ELMOD [Lepeophtheirus salmonis]|uniref:ELMOD n=1 Tax=Lepeophtheirus salmonis TaxID=72036 RepID=A0A7R8H1N9_LEPSM|nr:ELMOD [Lepeophtheirus salmonis]CAF2797376.1 ELMOD [Lepeophtheirus salmonis]